VTLDDVVLRYQVRLQELQAGMEHARAHSAEAAAVLVVAAAAFVVLGWYALRKEVGFWWPAMPLPVAAVAGRRVLRDRRAQYQDWRLKHFYQRALKRVQGDWAGKGVAGESFNDPDHPYANDLSIFGDGSLFELLCIGRSGIGQRGLAKCLLDAAALEEISARQEAVRELRDRTDLRERVALLGPHEFSESTWETFTGWLESPATRFPGVLSAILRITSVLVGLLVLAAIAAGGTLLPWIVAARLAAPLLLFHALVGLTLRERVNRMIDSLGALSGETQVLREGLGLLETEPWKCARLKEIATRARAGAESVRKLERLLGGLEQRNKDMFLYPSRLLMIGTQLCIAIEQWRQQYGSKVERGLRVWMEAWAEFEGLHALGCYAYENPASAFPDFTTDQACFEARALGHPLLPRVPGIKESCVTNDIELNQERRFYIVSGSNMSGKSTLLRAIGLNAVLAQAGAPVRAEALRLSRLAVCASINIADSLLNGKSKFLAEVDRLRLAIQTASGEIPVMFLVDEIFSGTNSRDRRVAAEAVVRTLSGRGAIGALSTHDLALTEIAEDGALRGTNVHMGSRGEGDPMDFDYLLKPGVTREANALAIARLAGVPVDLQSGSPEGILLS
jgi:hypothetical protein